MSANEKITNNFDVRYKHTVNELEETYKKNDLPSTSTLFGEIKNIFIGISGHYGGMIIERNWKALQIQEHLLQDVYSISTVHIADFTRMLNGRTGAGFIALQQELSEMVGGFGSEVGKWLPGGRDRWATSLKARVSAMKDGNSIWVDALTVKGVHGMMMRITKKGDKYDLRFANTGAGIQDNSDFHPKKTDTQTGKVLYQTVALIKDIDKDRLFESFHRFALAAHGELPPASSNVTEIKGQEDVTIINDMYRVLRELGTPVKVAKKNQQYWSREQEGSSCVPSSIWAMAKMVLNRDELHELKMDMRMTKLLEDYKEIKKGSDQDSTQKIIVLDLIQKLKGVYKKNGEKSPEIFDKIEKELCTSLEMIYPEIKIVSPSNTEIKHFTTQMGATEEYALVPVEATWHPRVGTCVTDLQFKKLEMVETYTVTKDPNYPENDIWHGKTVLDSIYLLYFHIAKGDQSKSIIYLKQVMDRFHELETMKTFIEQNSKKKKKLKNEKQLQLHGKKPTIHDLNSELKNKKSVLQKKSSLTIKLLTSLTDQFPLIDCTRSGIAKRAVLAKLNEIIPMKEIKERRNICKDARRAYLNMHVDFYLGKDQPYVRAYESLSEWSPQ